MNKFIKIGLLMLLFVHISCSTILERSTKYADYEENRSTLLIDGLKIPIAITCPVNKSLKASILIIPGALHSDVDGNYPEWNARPELYAQLGQELAKRGYKTLRYAKYGPKTGTEIVDEKDAHIFSQSFDHRVRVANLMAQELMKDMSNNVPLIVAGHSEGALVAMLFAQREVEIRGAILLAGTSQRYLDMVYDGSEKMIGSIPGVIDAHKSLKELKNAFAKVRLGKSITDELKTNPLLMGFRGLETVEWQFIREHDSYDPVQEIKKIHQPVFILQGKQDPLVEYKHAQTLSDAREKGEMTRVIFFDGLQHFFQNQPSKVDGMPQFSGTGPTDPVVIDTIDKWLMEVVLKN